MTDPEKIQNLADRLLMAAGVAEGRGDTRLRIDLVEATRILRSLHGDPEDDTRREDSQDALVSAEDGDASARLDLPRESRHISAFVGEPLRGGHHLDGCVFIFHSTASIGGGAQVVNPGAGNPDQEGAA